MKKTFWVIGLIVIILISSLWYFYKKDPPQVTLMGTKAGQEISSLNYLEAKEIIETQTNSFFREANGDNPQINLPLKNQNDKTSINEKRRAINTVLDEAWSKLVAEGNSQTNPKLQRLSANDSQKVATYLEELRIIIGKLSPENSGLAQNQIDNYQTAINEAQRKLLEGSKEETPAVTTPPLINLIGEDGLPKLIEGINHN